MAETIKRFVTEEALKEYHKLVKAALQANLADQDEIRNSIGDGTIKIQDGASTQIQTFSVNQKGDTTVTIPTATTNNLGLVKQGSSKGISIDSNGVVSIDRTTTISDAATNANKYADAKTIAEYVSDKVSSVMNFKGTIGEGGTITTLPSSALTGDAYRVLTPGTYGDNVCEAGDVIVATGKTTWTVLQNNIDTNAFALIITIGDSSTQYTPNNGTINLPAYPIVNDGKIQFQIAGVKLSDFEANDDRPDVVFNVPRADLTHFGVAKVKTVSTGDVAKSVGDTKDRYYGVGIDKSGYLYTNVPWTEVYNGKLTLQIAGEEKTSHTANDSEPHTFNVPAATIDVAGVGYEYDYNQVTAANFPFTD